MAKANEQKVDAVRRAEEASAQRIRVLEAELGAAKAGVEGGGNLAVVGQNKEMSRKVSDYQTFIATYIVDSQIEKAAAVAEAERKLIAKYEGLLALGGGIVGGAAGVTAANGAADVPETDYSRRNKFVAQAGAAGKSRWGAEEIQRASSFVPSASSASSFKVDQRVTDADHGIGKTEGIPLSKRINFGAALLGA
jgi:hypothetical protein